MSEQDLQNEIKRLEQVILQREQMIAELQNQLISNVDVEQLAVIINTQQIESLKDHLIRERKRVADLEKIIGSLQKKLDEKERELNNYKIQEREDEIDPSGQNISTGEIIEDEELDDLFSIEENEIQNTKPDTFLTREFIKQLIRHKKITVVDACLLLNTDKNRLIKVVNLLKSKHLIKGGRSETDDITPTKQLIWLARKLR